MNGKKIVVLGTGGTIAGTAPAAQDNIGYTAGQLGLAQLLEPIASLDKHRLVIEEVARIDSKDMGFDTWTCLALRCAHWLAQDDVAGIVIAHGTDTLEETAFFLQAVLAPAKPIVITCAMRPATALAPDGPQNLVDAVAVAVAPGACGVVAVCAGTVHGAFDVTKQHTYRLDAFSSGDAGPVGYVEEGCIRLSRSWPQAGTGSIGMVEILAGARQWPRVEIVMSHAGATGRLVEALRAQGIDGFVVAATGNGTVHREIEAALLEAQAAGVRVVRASRCPQGRILERPGDALRAVALSPVKARIALMLELFEAC
ncbi:MAG: asparaginase [Ramlibacter sp.]|nr:asparaginase [Ramlibacter sp.]